jgi:hypothetical protein
MQQSSRFPYGNAFFTSTPAMDRVGERMINDAKQQKFNEARQGQALDAEYGKNVSAIRDADIPDLTKKWGEYKALKMDLYKNGNKSNNDARIQKELEAQRKLGEAYQIINNSKVEKAGEDDYYKRYRNNPDKFEDIAPEFLGKRRNISVAQLQNTPFADIASNVELQNTDFSKPIVNAMGKETVRKTINNVSTDGLTTTPTEVKAFNSPRQYAAQLENEVFSNRKNKHLLNQFTYDGNKANEIVQRFNKLRETPEFKSAYGDEMNYTPEEFADPTKRTIALMSMEHALLHLPTLIEGKSYENYTQAIVNEKRGYDRGENDRRAKRNLEYSLIKIRSNIQNNTNEPTGNSFDETTTDFPNTGITIRNGVVRNKDGSLHSGDGLVISKELLPSSVITSLKSSGYKMDLIDGMKLSVKDGIIESMQNEYTGKVGRQNMQNYQRNFDKEPVKGQRQIFGNSAQKKNNAPAQSNNKPMTTAERMRAQAAKR